MKSILVSFNNNIREKFSIQFVLDSNDAQDKSKTFFDQSTICEEKEFVPLKNSNIDNLCKIIKITDMDCSLCYRLLHNPVSTPCGHVFCCACLDRSLDHKDNCPLCKRSLSDVINLFNNFSS
jgi:hypothetical protein